MTPEQWGKIAVTEARGYHSGWWFHNGKFERERAGFRYEQTITNRHLITLCASAGEWNADLTMREQCVALDSEESARRAGRRFARMFCEAMKARRGHTDD